MNKIGSSKSFTFNLLDVHENTMLVVCISNKGLSEDQMRYAVREIEACLSKLETELIAKK